MVILDRRVNDMSNVGSVTLIWVACSILICTRSRNMVLLVAKLVVACH